MCVGDKHVAFGTGVVVPIFKKGVCSNYNGITLLSLPGKVYSTVLKRRFWPIVKNSSVTFALAVKQLTCSLPSHACWDPLGNWPFRSTCVL